MERGTDNGGGWTNRPRFVRMEEQKEEKQMKTEKNAKGNTQVRPQVHFYKTKEGGEVGDEGADYADHHQSRFIL